MNLTFRMYIETMGMQNPFDVIGTKMGEVYVREP